MAIDFLARERHFADHLIPTWLALPKRQRGTFYVAPEIRSAAAAAGVDAVDVAEAGAGGLTVVASYRDLKHARDLRRLVVYSEHGAGQSYEGVSSGSYIGAVDRAGAVAALVPGELAAARHAATHPTIPAYAVGCPRLDDVHRNRRPLRDKPVIAISFHWDCRLCKETRSAFTHYRAGLSRLAQRFDLIGHCHPRAASLVQRHYKHAGVEFVPDFNEVLERADVYCIDNSSTMFEWASLDRPVVVMNAPWYRRKVEHGLRFWSHADVGPQVAQPAGLPAAIELALEDPEEISSRRREIVGDVYVACDGKAASRAAAVLQDLDRQWSGWSAGAYPPT